MTVADADLVDRISRSPDGGTYTLLMIEHRRFDGSEVQLQQLHDKINAYVAYLQAGQLHRLYPDARGAVLEVRLVCRDEPTGDRLHALLGAATNLFAKHGAEFIVEIISIELLSRHWSGSR